MKLLPLIALLSIGSASAVAQGVSVQQTIDEQVWKPFIQAYNNLDSEAFLALHTDDVIRVIRDGNQIKQGERYRADIRLQSERQRQRKTWQTIELRFTERFADGSLAFDAGYYKVVNRYSETEEYTFYGRFNVILRSENGRWKILMDSDTNDDGKISEADFLKGKAIE